MHLRVECPVGDVKALDRVGERRALELVRSEPPAAVPLADGTAHLVLTDLHRQQTLRPERRLDFLVRHQGGRTAKIASLPDALLVKDRNGLATLAFHRD